MKLAGITWNIRIIVLLFQYIPMEVIVSKIDTQVMDLLAVAAPLTQAEIAERINVRQGTISKSLKRLLASGAISFSRLSDGNAARYFPAPRNNPEYPQDNASIPSYSIWQDGDMYVYQIPRHAVPARPGPDRTLYLTYQDYYNPHLDQLVKLRWLDIQHDPLPNSYRNSRYEIVEPDGRITEGEPLPIMEYLWKDNTQHA